jgi:hypothetical protein
MKRFGRGLLAGVIMMLVVLVGASPAGAIVNGTPDGTLHPSVGAFFVDGRFACSGSLISPTVVLTAGHCTEFFKELGGTLTVTFDPNPSASSTYYTGTPYTNPAFINAIKGNSKVQQAQTDIGVVVLNSTVTGVPTVQLPTLNQFSNLAKKQPATVVGYGVEGKMGNRFVGGGTRMYASLYLVPAQGPTGEVVLKLNGPDGQGFCFGDSGGAIFLGGRTSNLQAAVTSFVQGLTCKSTEYGARLDTAEARSFLGQFVTLP